METFIKKLPKVELHLHIEGTLEPELMFKLADRNRIALKYNHIDEVRQAYQFTDLQSFLDLYFEGCNVLQTEEDFYDLTFAYLTKAHQQNVRHSEIFIDTQTHTDRGIAFETVINGISSAVADGQKKLGISGLLILCFLRHLSEQAAYQTLEQALPYKDKIIGIGLASSEKNNPPSKFAGAFAKARSYGFLPVAHAGEEGPADYIWQALNELQVKRIDHGVRCLEDDKLVQYLVAQQIPLTVCPLSNVKLCVFPSLSQHPLKKMLEKGICVTINSDDPAYFGGYIEENYLECYRTLQLSPDNLVTLAKNSVKASFLEPTQKDCLIKEIEMLPYVRTN